MIKFIISILFSLTALANYPPTTTKGSLDPNFVTTFNFSFPNVTMTHSGTTATFGVVGVQSGGTGQSSLTSNSVLLGNGTSGVQFVAPNTSGNVLQSNGTTWQSTALTFSGDVHGPASSTDSGIVLFSGASGKTIQQATGTGFVRSAAGVYQLSSAISLASDVAGILPLANGGTNASIAASNGGLAFSTASAISIGPVGSLNQLLTSNGTGAYSWTSNTFPSSATAPCSLLANTNNTITCLAATTGNRVLRTNGTTLSFSQLALSTDVTGLLPLANGGTNNNIVAVNGGAAYGTASGISLTSAGSSSTVLHGNGTGVAPSFAAVSMSADVTGILPLANGGTNANITASNGGIAFSTASGISLTAIGISGQVLTSQGTATPIWSAALTNPMTSSGDIIYGGASGVPTRLPAGADGTADVISGGVPTRQPIMKTAVIQLDNQAGVGSTATKIPYYTTTTTNSGNGILILTSNDSTNGAQVTALRPGMVTACMSFYSASVGEQIGVSLNGSPTTNLYVLTKSQRKAYANSIVVSGVGYANESCGTFPVTTNDVIRPHGDGGACGDTGSCSFWISAWAPPPY